MNKSFSNQVSNESALIFVQKLFGLEKNKEETNLLNPIVHRLINQAECELLNLDFNCSNNLVGTSSRLNLKSKIFYSKSCENLSGKRSYILCYLNDENNIMFGELEYFIKRENNIYAFISCLTFVNFIYFNLKGKLNNFMMRLKRQGFFDRFFYFYKRTKNKDIVLASKIINHCTFKELENNIFLICQNLNQTEHD